MHAPQASLLMCIWCIQPQCTAQAMPTLIWTGAAIFLLACTVMWLAGLQAPLRQLHWPLMSLAAVGACLWEASVCFRTSEKAGGPQQPVCHVWCISCLQSPSWVPQDVRVGSKQLSARVHKNRSCPSARAECPGGQASVARPCVLPPSVPSCACWRVSDSFPAASVDPLQGLQPAVQIVCPWSLQDVREGKRRMAKFQAMVMDLLKDVQERPPPEHTIAAHILSIRDPNTGDAPASLRLLCGPRTDSARGWFETHRAVPGSAAAAAVVMLSGLLACCRASYSPVPF